MAGLLSNQQEQQVRDAVKLVTDTFMVTPVVYSVYGESLDRFNEDRKDQSHTDYTLPCLVEYKPTKIKEELSGAMENFDVKLTINMDDLEALHLVTAPNWQVKFNATKDYFVCRGERYKVNYVGYDGPLSTKQCLVIITGVKDIKPS